MPSEATTVSDCIPASRSVRWTGLFLIVSGLLSGCATPDAVSAALFRSDIGLDDRSLIRSQDHSADDALLRENHSGPVSADYGHLQSRFAGRSGQVNGELVLVDRDTATGHSFLQPKGRLGRPVFLPETYSQPDRPRQEQSPANPAPQVNNDPLPDAAGRSPWPPEASGGWQPITEGTPSWSDPDEEYSERASGVNPPLESPLAANASAPATAVDSVGAEGVQATSDAEDAARSESSPDARDMANPETVPQQEPTMLDRLRRGLYPPRFEDNTDRLKKQFRRWPDPLGLLRDRVEAVVPGEEIPLASPDSGEIQTAESIMEQPGALLAAAASPTSPLDAVIAELEQELSAWPKSASDIPERPHEWRRRQTDLRMLYLVAGRSAECVRVIEALPEEEQEFWQSLMLAINEYRVSGDEERREAQLNQTIGHLKTATRKLQPLSTLEIRRLTFCDRIDGFGSVTEFPTADFDPGQRVLLYAEVQNFRTELTDAGNYRSEFAAVLEFRREGDDEVLDKVQLPQIQDECSAERSDYFQSFELTLPALAGKYQVRLSLKDQLSLRKAESQLEFHVR